MRWALPKLPDHNDLPADDVEVVAAERQRAAEMVAAARQRAVEMVEAERREKEKLKEKLRSLGIDPDAD